MMRTRPYNLTTLIVAAALAIASAAPPATANWTSVLLREAGHAGGIGAAAGKALKLGIPSLEGAAALVAKLPASSKALAAHVTAEGHWKFVNREGEVFTAATADELQRASGALLRDGSEGKLAILLTDDTVFKSPGLLKDLPAESDLFVVSEGKSYRLTRSGEAGAEKLAAEIAPNISVTLDDQRLFRETAFQLARPLNRSNIRVLAIEPGGPKTLSSVPRFDPATKAALVDQIDPGALETAFGKLKGQTVLVTGRVEDGALTFLPSSGGEQKIFIESLLSAAEKADVNLVLVESAASRQPGGRNWLWQKVEIAGLDEAMQRATIGDFLNALGADGRKLSISAADAGQGRVTLTALPAEKDAIPGTGLMTEWIGEVTGRVVVHSIKLVNRDEERQQELDARFIPGVPSFLQYGYIIGIVAGVIGLSVSRSWWAKLWPAESRSEYGSAAGYFAARLTRALAFVLLFLPIAGYPAILIHIARELWAMILVPFRVLGWLKNRLFPKAAV